MSEVYWGIVLGLLAMVATLFICVDILYSKPKGSPKVTNDKADESGQAVAQPSAGSRQAA
ncbi:MAG: hypothetical protein ABI856_19320 [Nitrospira sp.]